MTNALTRRTAAPPANRRPVPPPLPEIPFAIASELSRAMEPLADRGALLPLDGPAWVACQNTIAGIQATLAVLIHPDDFDEWLQPIRWGVRNPPDDDQYPPRRRALFTLLHDLPAICFTIETRLAVATEFFPSAIDIRKAVEPVALRLRATLDGLRRIPHGPPDIAIEAPPQDPAIAIAAVRAFQARQDLMDGRLRALGRGLSAEAG